jgi:hypothetical protein
MQKLDKSQLKRYWSVNIWADDLNMIVQEIQSCCKSVKIVADDIQYDNIDEFVKEHNGRRPKSVEISGFNPYVSVKFNKHEC